MPRVIKEASYVIEKLWAVRAAFVVVFVFGVFVGVVAAYFLLAI